jgi:hypothetical protein
MTSIIIISAIVVAVYVRINVDICTCIRIIYSIIPVCIISVFHEIVRIITYFHALWQEAIHEVYFC